MSKPTYAEVDLSAVRYNIKGVRERVGPHVRIMPAVKANGYGHGAVQVSQACINAGADTLCVSCVEEAIELREASIDVPILILGCSVPSAIDDIVRYDIISTVCDTQYAQLLSAAAVKQSKSARIHIKVDTGMGRIGLQPCNVLDTARALSILPNVVIEGAFTHFPCSDESDKLFTLSQIDKFSRLVAELRKSGIDISIAHSSNSGGILAFPEADFNAVRPGIMTYGYYPSDEVARTIPIHEVLTLKTHVVFLKDMDSGATVSYGRTHHVKRHSRVATLPVGYADGYSRLLSNRGEAAIRGIRVPIIGRICMDQCLVDVTDVPGVSVGDEVVLYGGGYDYLSVAKIAETIGTISYEVLCNIGMRVPRVYLNE
ncbi:MAG: alanine racemase [Armatimonadota bacterium]|nr:alanine racemase [bacterium]